jgi:hypothetical protein
LGPCHSIILLKQVDLVVAAQFSTAKTIRTILTVESGDFTIHGSSLPLIRLDSAISGNANNARW